MLETQHEHLETEIEAFFASYIEAFEREDANALSELWEPVGLFPSPTGNFSMEREAFRDHCVSLMNFYREQGVAKPEGELLSVSELFPNVVEARVDYRMLGSKDDLIASWQHVYILRKGEAWRVSLTIADGEMAAWSEKGVSV